MQEVPVDAREGVVVEGAERRDIEAESFGLLLHQLHQRDREHRQSLCRSERRLSLGVGDRGKYCLTDDLADMNPHLTLTRTRNLLVCGLAAAITLGALTTLAHATTPGKNGLIAFTRYRLQDTPIWSEIFVANPDGSGERKVSHSPTAVEDDQAHWSPDGKWIVFDRCTANGPCSLWLVRPDGTRPAATQPALPCESSANGVPRRQRPVLRPRRPTRRVHARVGPRQADLSR